MRDSILDIGSGPALLLIPGIQGRWEWMTPAIEALASDWRVLACSLPGEPGSGHPPASSFDDFVQYIDDVLDTASVASAVVCGVSFGGLLALHYASERPARVRGLILVATPGPRWQLKPQFVRYLAHPTLSSPLFFAGSIRRFWPELRATFPKMQARLRFCAAALGRVLAAPAIPSRMSSRARLLAGRDFVSECARVTAPTLVIAGEAGLDRVVEHHTTKEYVDYISGAELQVLERTGHLGLISAPGAFAARVAAFQARLVEGSDD